ncbi:RING finger protein 17 [Myotis brandtii]|uniref:RING finger protein 17 n=1 Tax=Myotis brandtii TaxID=109478 RepID=S7Q603_MYOBR|nr:RING finger protein 17 [Myotis brandtii]
MQINHQQRWWLAATATQLKRAGGLLAPVMEEAKLPPCCGRALSSTLSNKVAIIEAKQTPDTCFQQAMASELEQQQSFNYRRIKNCSQDFKKTADQLTIGLEHIGSPSTHRTVLSSSAVMAETKTTEEIDEALKIAGNNFEQLSIAVKMLEHIHNQTQEETVSLLKDLEKQFDQLFTSLDSRKKNLCEEVARKTDAYLSNVIMAKNCIEERKNDLNAAMKIARELKSAPSLRTYCDLNQIIRALKLTFENELPQVSALKLRKSPRLNMSCSEIISVFNSMIKIDFEDSTKYPQENEIGQNLQKKYNHEKKFSCRDTFPSPAKKKVDMPVLTNEPLPPPLQPETDDVHLEAKNFQPQKEVVATTSPKSIAALPQMGSSPDVIIEEIIEENLETCLTDDLTGTPSYPNKLLQKKSSAPFGSKAGSPELVFVSHVIHPCHFYIRKYSQINDATVLEKMVNQFCNKSLHLDPSDILELGATVFVSSIGNGMWCRGIITELIPIENENIRKHCSPTKFSVSEVALIQIFMVDFGNSEVLIVAGVGDTHVKSEHIAEQHIVLNDLCLVLRKSEPYIEGLLKDFQPLAQPCSLKDIVPQNSNEAWGEEAKVEFLKMVNNKAVLMKVFREEDGVLIVDLQKPPTNKISSDMPVSLRDALVFMELASLSSITFSLHLPPCTKASGRSDPACTHLGLAPPAQLLYHYTTVLLSSGSIGASTASTASLSQRCDANGHRVPRRPLVIESLDFLFLLKTIEDFYKSEDGENLEILCPVQDQACVAKFEDGVWYRAKVIGLPGHREVEVKYVDFGNTAKITLKEMRKIKDEFLNPPEKAIKCKLAYIEPCKGTLQWSKKAKEKFEEKTQDKFMTCSVIRILEDNVLLVELFDSLGAPGMTPTSINDQLIKEGLASYEVGYTIKDNSKKHTEVWDPSPEEIISNEVNNLNSVTAKSLPNENLQSLYNKELPVHICNVISPEKIYVQWLLTENLLNSLEEKMVAAYENSQWEPIKWENDMHCAVKIPDNNQWRRGQIIRMVTDTLVEVLLYDVGVELVVNINCLRELQENLKTMGRLCLECSLVDIRINKLDNSHSLSEKSLEIPLKQEDSVVTKCIKINFDPDKKAADIINEHRVSAFKENVLEARTPGCYKPPVIPNMKVFEAVVSCIGDDGTVFVVPKLSEFELIKMMNEIQSNLKCLGLLEPYFWKKGEACAVRGSDTMWYRGKVIEVVGGTIRVQYLDHGLTEKIPQCHLYPILLYPDTPQFCIPCQLYHTIPELLLSETETPILPPYLPSSLPPPEELYAVQVKHVVSPNEVYICLDSVENCNLCNQHSDTDDSGVSWESESESLNEALRRFNTNVETFPPLTDFRTEMPCLAEYDDGLWYRAKIVSIKEFNPLAILVQFVDYGSTEKLTINRF